MTFRSDALDDGILAIVSQVEGFPFCLFRLPS
jgi:hypothetical protein